MMKIIIIAKIRSKWGTFLAIYMVWDGHSNLIVTFFLQTDNLGDEQTYQFYFDRIGTWGGHMYQFNFDVLGVD